MVSEQSITTIIMLSEVSLRLNYKEKILGIILLFMNRLGMVLENVQDIGQMMKYNLIIFLLNICKVKVVHIIPDENLM